MAQLREAVARVAQHLHREVIPAELVSQILTRLSELNWYSPIRTEEQLEDACNDAITSNPGVQEYMELERPQKAEADKRPPSMQGDPKRPLASPPRNMGIVQSSWWQENA